VGFVANPASRRDIRRLVAGATVFRNADKPGMMFRLLSPAPGTRRTGSRPAASTSC